MIVVLSAFIVSFAEANSTEYAKPNPKAPQGGTFVRVIGAEPPTIHPIMSTDLYSRYVRSYVFETLLSHDPNTWEYVPSIAEKWEISKDGKEFTFFLNPKAKFHDGKPVTAEDVKFSLEAIFEPKHEAAHLIPYFEAIEYKRTQVINPTTIKFFTKSAYYKNFDVASSFYILPKHVYGDIEKSRRMTTTAVGSGPYVLDKFERGQKISLKKFTEWFPRGSGEEGSMNFARLEFRVVKDENIQLERMKKGDFDFLAPLTPEAFVKKTEGPPWGKSVFKVKAKNDSPKPFGFIGWNLQNELFKSRDVRVALNHLMNREEMNKKFRFGLSELATGPLVKFSEQASPNVKPILFDSKKARELLTKEGWTDTDKDGVLDKKVGDKKTDFKFSLLYANQDNEKYWTLYREDLLKAGIVMELKYSEWNSFSKTVDEKKFDAIAMGWGAVDVDWEPRQIWHSDSAKESGSNYISYKNPEVDKLIDQAGAAFDKSKRIELRRKIYELIAADAPYVFLFNDVYTFYARSGKVETPGDAMRYDIGFEYWWSKAP